MNFFGLIAEILESFLDGNHFTARKLLYLLIIIFIVGLVYYAFFWE